MKNPNFALKGTPPLLFPTLLKGFNTIANHWYLILFPILMDILLWLGPKISVKNVFSAATSLFSKYTLEFSTPEMLSKVQESQLVWEKLLDQFNLASALRTFPIGVPSLIARESPGISPFGNSLIFEIPTIQWVFGTLGLLLLVGFLLGSIYFLLISQVTSQDHEKLVFKDVLSSYAQSLVMFCLMVLLIVFVLLPIFMLLSLLSLINLEIGQFFIMAGVFVLLWLLMPLVFAPHGIFVLKQKALPSMLISIRLVRLFLPGTGMFVVMCLLISEGLNFFWAAPEAQSWLTLLSIGGHSFIITGLLAASFIYYRDGLRWMQENLQRMAEATKKEQENGGTTLEQQ